MIGSTLANRACLCFFRGVVFGPQKLNPWRLTVIPMSSSSQSLVLFAKNISEDHMILDVYTNILEKLAQLSDRRVADSLVDEIRNRYSRLKPDYDLLRPIPAGSVLDVTDMQSMVLVRLELADMYYGYVIYLDKSDIRKLGVQTLPLKIRFD